MSLRIMKQKDIYELALGIKRRVKLTLKIIMSGNYWK